MPFFMMVIFFTLREPVRDIMSIFSFFINHIHCQFKGTAMEPDRLQGLIWESIYMSLEWSVNMRVIGLIEFKLFLLKRIHFFSCPDLDGINRNRCFFQFNSKSSSDQGLGSDYKFSCQSIESSRVQHGYKSTRKLLRAVQEVVSFRVKKTLSNFYRLITKTESKTIREIWDC